MLAYADNEFRRRDENMRAELPVPALAYIWDWFLMLSPCRDSGYSAGPISHREIQAWSQLRRIGITPSEVDTLRRIDDAFLTYHYEKTNPAKPASLSDALGDAALEAQARRDATAARKRPSPPISRKG